MTKRILIISLIFILSAFSLSAEQLSKIGIVNFSRIVDDYFAESSAWREVDSMRENTTRAKMRSSMKSMSLRWKNSRLKTIMMTSRLSGLMIRYITGRNI